MQQIRGVYTDTSSVGFIVSSTTELVSPVYYLSLVYNITIANIVTDFTELHRRMRHAAEALGKERMRAAALELQDRKRLERQEVVRQESIRAANHIAKLRQQDIDRKRKEQERNESLRKQAKRFVRSFSNDH